MNYDLILFDLDGTLVDTLPDIAASLNHTLSAAGYAPLPQPVVRTLVGEGMRRLVEKALAAQPGGPRTASPAEIQALVDGHNGYYADHVCVFSKPYEGVYDLLSAIAPHATVAVLSNKPGPLVRALLDDLALSPFVDAAIGDYDGYPIKPDPAAATHLMQTYGVPPARTLMVGDGIPDMRLARAIGCDIAAALWGFTAPEELAALAPTFALTKMADLLAKIGLDGCGC